MNSKEFMEQLNKAQELMNLEKYKEAMVILNKLKEIEKNSDYNFNYGVIHTLYQLDSNCRSILYQELILNHIEKISQEQKSISFKELNQIIKETGELNISVDILRREIELLILRNLLSCKIEGNQLIC